jgi:hypothetical protein
MKKPSILREEVITRLGVEEDEGQRSKEVSIERFLQDIEKDLDKG